MFQYAATLMYVILKYIFYVLVLQGFVQINSSLLISVYVISYYDSPLTTLMHQFKAENMLYRLIFNKDLNEKTMLRN